MKNFKFPLTILIGFLVFLFAFFMSFSVAASKEKKSLIFLLMSNETRKKEKEEEIKKAEETVKQIKSAYNKKLYHKVIELLSNLPPDFSLTPEENLIISESFLNSGFPEKAIEFSEKVISVKKGTHKACIANLIKNKGFIIKGDYKNAKKELKDFLNSYCNETLKKEAKILLYFIKELPEKELKEINKDLIKKVLGEIYKLRGLYFIRKGKLKKAEEDFFTYINVYGTFKEGSELMYSLAEAYLKKNKKDKAKILYELIITNWDGTKEALFSKFRLYQMAYEKILIKELIPKKTKQDLISFATAIKTRYPEEKIAEEASLTIIKTYFEDKNYLLARKNAIKFLETYKKSPLIEKVKMYYCESVSQLFEKSSEKRNPSLIVQIEKEDKEFLKRTKCGKAYYILGNIYLDYNFYTKASYCFIKAYETGGKGDLISKVLLRLGVLALEEDKKSLFKEIFSFLTKKGSKTLKRDPYYFYLKAFHEMQNDLKKGEIYLNLALESSLPERFKEKVLKYFRDRALSLKNYAKALEYTNHPFFNAKADDYLILLLETFYKDQNLFEKTLKYAKKKFPDNSKIKWLEAYYLENIGNIRASTKIWSELTQGNSLENELAKSYEKMKYLIEKTHQMVF